ncbi:MAG: response regulator transcription factor [Wenzhouxiangellaceae bacterium]
MTDVIKLLLVDDDATFLRVLDGAMQRRGCITCCATDTATALALASEQLPQRAVLDLNLEGESGLQLIEPLLAIRPDMQIVVLTGYASIATAVEAIKLGAVQYLTKPADAEQISQAFAQLNGNAQTPLPENPMSVRRMEWEHVQRVLAECDGNISAAARKLNMHRRTLQRKLRKYPVKS